MLDVVVIGLRWLQFGGAVVLLGTPLFLLHSLRRSDGVDAAWVRPTLAVAALTVALASLAALVAQTAVMAGSLGEAVKFASLAAMVDGTALGKAMIVRAGAAVFALLGALVLKRGRLPWIAATLAGLVVSASFAWTGHGAATEGPAGPFHLVADVVHAVAAAIWLGALAALTILLLRRTPAGDVGIHRALHGFSSLGAAAVALLVLTGLVNSWFLVGPAAAGALSSSPYGQLLLAKLGLFVLMLGLAVANRYRLVPALGSALAAAEDAKAAFRSLRLSVVAETLAGIGLLGVVAVMGTLPPPASM